MNIAAEKLHWKLQGKVIDRAFLEIPNLRHEVPRFSLMMDRSTYPGKLKDCFVPRCCRP